MKKDTKSQINILYQATEDAGFGENDGESSDEDFSKPKSHIFAPNEESKVEKRNRKKPIHTDSEQKGANSLTYGQKAKKP